MRTATLGASLMSSSTSRKVRAMLESNRPLWLSWPPEGPTPPLPELDANADWMSSARKSFTA